MRVSDPLRSMDNQHGDDREQTPRPEGVPVWTVSLGDSSSAGRLESHETGTACKLCRVTARAGIG